MRAEIYWIDLLAVGRLAIAPRPRAGDWLEDEVRGWASAGATVVVSLLEDAEIRELGLGDEENLCRACGINFVRFPIRDRDVPASLVASRALAESLASKLAAGAGVVIHCRAGIGRSGTMAAATLHCAGIGENEAWRAISNARGLETPDTQAQRDWITNFINL